MDLDRQLFQSLEKGKGEPTVRIYGWKPSCISVGYAQDIEKLVDIERAEELGFDVVQRPTGGGIVFHNEDEVTFSIVGRLDDPELPQGLIPLYLYFSERVVGVLRVVGVKAKISSQGQGLGQGRGQENPAPAPWPRPGEAGRKNPLCFANPAEYEITVDGRKIVGMAQRRGRKAFLIQGSILVTKGEYPKGIDSIGLKEIYPQFDSQALINSIETAFIDF
jgi:lipoate-protein ligase A